MTLLLVPVDQTINVSFLHTVCQQARPVTAAQYYFSAFSGFS